MHTRFTTGWHRSSRNEESGAARRCTALLGALLIALGSAHAQEPADPALLASDRGCMRCHAMARKAVGPGFAQIALRYQDDPAAASRLAGKIRNGAVGAWGRVIMPRQPAVTEAEAQVLAAWVLAQRPR